ncbi:MAG TPA: TonB-dependent receptor, partial [Chitinophagaceae bacterium]
SNGAHEGTNRYEYGEPGLNSETSLQIDLGLDVDNEHFSFSLSGFYNNVNDFIYYSRLSSASGGDSIVVVDGEDLEAFRFNQQNASLSGLEASFDFHPHPVHWLHFENTVSLIRGRFHKQVDGSDNLPMIPAGRWISELRANVNKASNAVRNLYFKVEMDNTFEQNRPFFGYNTETPTKGYALLNAGLGMDIYSRGKPVLNIHISGNNLTDEAYQNHLNRLKYTAINNATGRRGVFNMGRNFSFKLNIPLEFHVK